MLVVSETRMLDAEKRHARRGGRGGHGGRGGGQGVRVQHAGERRGAHEGALMLLHCFDAQLRPRCICWRIAVKLSLCALFCQHPDNHAQMMLAARLNIPVALMLGLPGLVEQPIAPLALLAAISCDLRPAGQVRRGAIHGQGAHRGPRQGEAPRHARRLPGHGGVLHRIRQHAAPAPQVRPLYPNTKTLQLPFPRVTELCSVFSLILTPAWLIETKKAFDFVEQLTSKKL